ncbi:GIY-YIG nuclease family protein [Elizabethkingia anophelis]|uniref:GIY-YIG nuclease family protein n=1 Tax=Elizabethkingia anophelis TaxID=1117645 RepID=UPI00389234DB
MESKIYYIYALVDPISNDVKYIGCTQNLKVRYSYHINDVHSDRLKSKWTLSLRNKGLKPILKELDSTTSVEHAIKLEQKYFKDFDNGQTVCSSPERFRYARSYKRHINKSMRLKAKTVEEYLINNTTFKLSRIANEMYNHKWSSTTLNNKLYRKNGRKFTREDARLALKALKKFSDEMLSLTID